jgi:NitT/TauT family transport system substrate-binding protein
MFLREAEMLKIGNALMFGLLFLLLATAVKAQGVQRISIAWTPSQDIPQIAQAIDKNLWKQEGLEVKMVTFPTGREALEALLGGQVDFASMAELPAVTGAMRQQKFAVLSVLSRYRANRIIATSDIAFGSIRDLAGRKIGTTLGTNSHFALDWELQKAGIKAVIVNVAPPDIVSVLARGDIDAAVMFPAFFGQAKRVLGGRYREVLTPDYATHMLLAGTSDVIEKQADVVRRVLAALLKAEEIVAKSPAETQETVVRVVGKVIGLEAVRVSWPEYDYKMGLGPELLDLMVRQGQWIRDRGLIKNVEPNEQLFRSYIRDGTLRALANDRVTLR